MLNKRKKKTGFYNAAAVIFWLLIWELAAVIVGSELILPSPLSVAAALLKLLADPSGEYILSTLVSAGRITVGFLTGAAAGIILGLITGFSPLAEILLKPLRNVIRATPVASIIVLLLLWLKRSVTPIAVCLLIVTPVVWSAVTAGLAAADRKLMEMADVFSFSRLDKLRFIYLPQAAASLKAGLISSLGLAFKSAIAAEVLATPALSIGKNIYEAKIYLETPQLFAWTVLVVLLSAGSEALIKKLLGGIRS